MNPAQLLFAKTHEWIHVSDAGGGKLATIGISAFAVEQLTDLVYLDLPEVGLVVSAGNSIGEIESVKAVSDIYTPVSGQIMAVNAMLSESLETLGQDPFGAGWIVKIRMTNESELRQLLDYASYQRQCAEEG